jgi:hypothetical protein
MVSAPQVPSSRGSGGWSLRVGCYVAGGLASAVVLAVLVLLAVDGHPFGLLAAAVGFVIPFPLRGIAYLLGVPRPVQGRKQPGRSESPVQLRFQTSTDYWRPAPPEDLLAPGISFNRSARTGDPIAAAAHATAGSLAVRYGPGVEAEVGSALQALSAQQRPEQYFDPATLGSLVVSIARLAWTIYVDLRKRSPSPAPETVAREVRIQLREHGDETPTAAADQITAIVVTEIIHAADIPD